MGTRATQVKAVTVCKAVLVVGCTLVAWVAVRRLEPGAPPPGEGRGASSSSPSSSAIVVGQAAVMKPDASDEPGELQSIFRSIRQERKTRFARQSARFLWNGDDPPGSVQRENARNRWISGLDARQTSAALAHLGGFGADGAFRADMQARLIRHLAEIDPSSAIRQIGTIQEGTGRDLALENVAIVQANVSLDGTFNWLNQFPEGTDRDVATFAVATEAVRSEPTAALRLAMALPASDASDELIRRSVAEWAATDQPGATAWARQLPDGPLRAQVLGTVATVWADRDPVAAGNFALDELPPGRMQDDVLVGVAQRWAQQSPQAAAAWVGSLPNGQLRSAAADSVAAIWARSAAGPARRWRTAIGVGP